LELRNFTAFLIMESTTSVGDLTVDDFITHEGYYATRADAAHAARTTGWGGVLEAAVLADGLEMNIFVWTESSPGILSQLSAHYGAGDDSAHLHLRFRPGAHGAGGNHYDLLRTQTAPPTDVDSTLEPPTNNDPALDNPVMALENPVVAFTAAPHDNNSTTAPPARPVSYRDAALGLRPREKQDVGHSQEPQPPSSPSAPSKIYILDTGATVHVVSKSTHVRGKRSHKTVKGVGGKYTSCEEAEHNSLGDVLVLPNEVERNIISFNRLKRTHAMRYLPELDAFEARRGAEVYLFEQRGGLYELTTPATINFAVADLADAPRLDHSQTPNTQTSLPAAATSNPRHLHQRPQLNQAQKQALRLHDILHHPSDDVLAHSITHGIITNAGCTAADLRSARKLTGPCVGCLQGKSTEPPSPASSSALPALGTTLHADITFATDGPDSKAAFLLAVEPASSMVMARRLPARTAAQLLDNLLALANEFQLISSVKVNTIRTDPEPGFVAIRDELAAHGVRLVLAAPERHVKVAERAIREIKNYMRSTLASLPFTLPHFLYPSLLDHHHATEVHNSAQAAPTMTLDPAAPTMTLDPAPTLSGRPIRQRRAPQRLIEDPAFASLALPADANLGENPGDSALPPIPLSDGNLTVSQALSLDRDKAIAALHNELGQMLRLKVFGRAPRAHREGVLPSKMFLKWKYASGTLKLKARLVIGGHLQARTEATETYSPTVCGESVNVALAIAAHHRIAPYTIDVSGAFLHVPLEGTEVFMRLPKNVAPFLIELAPDFAEDVARDGTITVRILKAIYGLRASSLQWHRHLSSTLASIGYTRLLYDRSVFVMRRSGKLRSIICVHVDDLLVINFDNSCKTLLKDALIKAYEKITVSEESSFTYLGVHVHYTDGTLRLHQRALIDTIDYPSPARVLANAALGDILIPDNSTPATNPAAFRSTLMRILYITSKTRFDLMFPVSILAGRQQSPSARDEAHLQQLVAYLKRTSHWHYTIQPENLTLNAAADASFACHSDGKGHTGFLCLLGGSVVFARSGKQDLVTKSSAEAELLALNNAADQVCYLRNLLEELDAPQPQPTPIFQDNLSTIQMANKGELGTKRTKHFTVRHYHVTDLITKGLIALSYEPGSLILADGLTKPLTGPAGRTWGYTILGLRSEPALPCSARGGLSDLIPPTNGKSYQGEDSTTTTRLSQPSELRRPRNSLSYQVSESSSTLPNSSHN
jgi:hypothetical protein